MKMLLILSLITVSSVSLGNPTIYGGLVFDTASEMGYTAGGNWFYQNDKKLRLGVETGISYWDIDVATLTILELMPMLRYGERLFVDFGLGVEHNIAKVGSKTYSDMKSGVGINAGFMMDKIAIVWRYRLVQTTSLFGFTIGYTL